MEDAIMIETIERRWICPHCGWITTWDSRSDVLPDEVKCSTCKKTCKPKWGTVEL